MNTNQVPKPAELPKVSELLFFYLGVVCFIMVWLPMPNYLLDFMLAFSLSVTIVSFFCVFYVRQIKDLAYLASTTPFLTLFRMCLAVALYRTILIKGMGIFQLDNPQMPIGVKANPLGGTLFYAVGELLSGAHLLVGFALVGVLIFVSLLTITSCWMLLAPKVKIAKAVLSQQRCFQDETVEHQTVIALKGGVSLLLGEVVTLTVISIGLIWGIEYVRHNLPEYAYTLRKDFWTVGFNYFAFLLVPAVVSVIPALFFSVCFTLVALRPSGQEKTLGPACVEELQKYPYGLILAAAFLGLIGFSGLIGTGMPLWAFGPIAVGLGAIAFNVFLAQDVQAQLAELNQFRDQGKINTAQLQTFGEDHALVLELGSGLHQIAEPRPVQQRPGVPPYIALKEQLLSPKPLWGFHKAFGELKERLFNDLGYILPELRFLENQQLSLDTYRLKIYDKIVLEGVIQEDDRSESLLSLIEQMEAVIKTEVESLVSRQTVENMLGSLATSRPELSHQLQQQVGTGALRDILISLLKQGQSIRHLGSLGERVLGVWEKHESPDAETIARHLLER